MEVRRHHPWQCEKLTMLPLIFGSSSKEERLFRHPDYPLSYPFVKRVQSDSASARPYFGHLRAAVNASVSSDEHPEDCGPHIYSLDSSDRKFLCESLPSKAVFSGIEPTRPRDPPEVSDAFFALNRVGFSAWASISSSYCQASRAKPWQGLWINPNHSDSDDKHRFFWAITQDDESIDVQKLVIEGTSASEACSNTAAEDPSQTIHDNRQSLMKGNDAY